MVNLPQPSANFPFSPVQYGTAEALEGGIRRASRSKNKGSGSGSGAAGCPSSSEDQGGVGGAADTTAVALEAGELLREAAGLVDTIASEHVAICFNIIIPVVPRCTFSFVAC